MKYKVEAEKVIISDEEIEKELEKELGKSD